MRLIDAHHHLWSLARGDYGWIDPTDPILGRDYGPGDSAAAFARFGVDGGVLVQAAPTEAETGFLLGLAHRERHILGVVGWADFGAARLSPATLEHLQDPALLGLRPMLQDLEDDRWILRPEAAPLLDALEAHDKVFEALVRPRHLPVMRALRERRPGLRMVLDHAAKPDLAHGDLRVWARDLSALAADPGVTCKLSGLVTEADADWTVETLRPVFDTLVAAFGAGRLMWGSDWPVVRLRGEYGDWLAAALRLAGELPPRDQAAIFGASVRAAYRLSP